MDFGGQLSPAEMDAVIADAQNRVRSSFASRPVFGVSGWNGPVMIGEWSWGEGARGVAHGSPDGEYIQVQTHADDARLGVHTMRMNASGGHGELADYDSPPDRLVEITIDETPVVFEVWEGDPRAWAGGTYLGLGVVVESRGADLDGLRLNTVDDIEPYLEGQLELINRARRSIDPRAGSHDI